LAHSVKEPPEYRHVAPSSVDGRSGAGWVGCTGRWSVRNGCGGCGPSGRPDGHSEGETHLRRIDPMKDKDMKIAVYGATGAIGSVIVTEASARGHQVTGISRRGGDLTGDALDPVFTADVAANHDVVVSAISGRAGPRTTAPASRTASPTWPTLSATDGCSSSAEPAALPSTASGCSTHRSSPKSTNRGAQGSRLTRRAASSGRRRRLDLPLARTGDPSGSTHRVLQGRTGYPGR